MTVTARVRQPLQHQHTHALRPADPVGAVGERLASPVHRQATLPGEPDEGVRGRHHRGPARQRQRAIARAQRLRRQMQRHQRRRAGRVHGYRRAFQAEGVGHPAGGDARRGPGSFVTLDRVASAKPLDHLASRGLMHPAGGVAQGQAVVVVHHPGEHTGLAAPQRPRLDPRPLDRLPRHLQQQPLLRVDRQRLPRRDPEEPRVELIGVVQESAVPGVRRPHPARIRIVNTFQIPAAVGRETSDRVSLPDHQPPQILRRGDPTRIPARHPHDHNRVVRHRTHHRRQHSRTGLLTQQLAQQELRQHDRRRVVEHQRRRQPQPRHRTQPVTQLHRRERVKTQLTELMPRLDGVRRRVPQHRRDLRTHQVQHKPHPIGLSHAGQPPTQRPITRHGRQRRCRRRRPANPPRQPAQQMRHLTAYPRHGRRIQPCRHHCRTTHHTRRVEQGQPLLDRQGRYPRPRHTPKIDLSQSLRHPRVLRPRTPGKRQPRQPQSTPMLSQRIQERVRRRVVALTRPAERPRHRREHDKLGQIQVPGQLVQMPGGIHLRPQHRIHTLRRQRRDRAVGQYTGGVNDRRQRMSGIHPGHQRSHLIPIRHIARRDLHLGAVRDQLGPQLQRTRGIGPPAAGQQQTPNPTLGHHMPREQRAQTTGATGDQHCPFRVPRADTALTKGLAKIRAGCHPRQAGNQHPTAAHRHLRLTRGQHPGQHRRRYQR